MKSKAKNLIFWIRTLGIAVAGVLLLQLFAFSSCYIPSSGMENSLYPGDHLIINKWAYGLRLPFMTVFGYQRINDKPLHKNDIVVFNNPFARSTKVPADRREVFISRCMGLPGDTLMMSPQYSIICPRKEVNPDHKQLYVYPKDKENSIEKQIKQLGIEENKLIGYNKMGYVRSFSRYEIYLLQQEIPGLKIKSVLPDTCELVHALVVPGRGRNIHITPWNITFLRNAINEHEGKRAFIINDSLLYVNGQKVSSYVFTKDYYWMVSNNSININDSRIFGFVPKDHIIGKASLIWFSKDSGAGFFSGFRWKRFFQSVQ
ncbi:signal peptidase I [uncultured Bacteroides sp.]|uniref:signal peptidase I n=1 Tax=uncultured Bacteroides sp. TaxID=162156 RepID=UPI002AAB7057|nr:signal peptidase I [uncultured Bacteroides sp.]